MLLSPNPLIPATYDIAWSTMTLVLLALLVVAVASIARSARTLTPGQALGWTLLAIFVPGIGPLAWLFIGRRTARTSVTAPEGRGLGRD